MKKPILVVTLLFLSVFANAQTDTALTYKFSGNPYSYQGVVKTDSSSTKNQLYSKAIEWFAVTFKDSKAVMQMQDKDNGIIIGKGDFLWSYQYPSKYVGPTIGYVYFTIRISVKDGRFKYELFHFNTEGYGTIKDGTITKYPDIKGVFGSGKKWKAIALQQFTNLQEQTVKNAESIINDLKATMLKNKADNW